MRSTAEFFRLPDKCWTRRLGCLAIPVMMLSAVWAGAQENYADWSAAVNSGPDGVPQQYETIIYDNTSAKICLLDVSSTVYTIDFMSDFTGNFNFGSDSLRMTSTVDFSTGGTITGGSGALIKYM